MGKKITYINAKGQEIAKLNFDAGVDAKVVINPKDGSWELFMTCVPTKEMLDAAEGKLTEWLKTRRAMAAPYEKGSKVAIDDDKPDYFSLKLPQSSISEKQTLRIGESWVAWRKKFEQPAQATQPTKSTPTPAKTTPAPQPTKSTPTPAKTTPAPAPAQTNPDPAQTNPAPAQTTPAPAQTTTPAPAPAQTNPPKKAKKFWEMTDEERIAHNKERMAFYLGQG